MILRAEGGRSALVTKDHVRVDVGIKVLNAILRDSIDKGGLPLTRRVIGAITARVVRSVTVNV